MERAIRRASIFERILVLANCRGEWRGRVGSGEWGVGRSRHSPRISLIIADKRLLSATAYRGVARKRRITTTTTKAFTTGFTDVADQAKDFLKGTTIKEVFCLSAVVCEIRGKAVAVALSDRFREIRGKQRGTGSTSREISPLSAGLATPVSFRPAPHSPSPLPSGLAPQICGFSGEAPLLGRREGTAPARK
jgi:hypothetical protein